MSSKNSKKQRNNPFTFIDLFAGAGGLSLGLEMSGFNLLYANEIEPSHAAALKLNHPNAEIDINDIRQVDAQAVRKSLGLAKGELTLLAGGPPCQGFSVNAPVRSSKDRRNHLFRNYLEFVKEFKPQAVLIENVPGMLSYNKGETVKSIVSALEDFQYSVAFRILYAPHYGVPQMRWRTVFLAVREKVSAVSLFPAPTHQATGRANFTSRMDGKLVILSKYDIEIAPNKGTTVADAIGDLPPIKNGGGFDEVEYPGAPKSNYQKILRDGSQLITHHRCAGLGQRNLERIPHIPPGGSWRDIPFAILPAGMKRARRSDHTKRYGRLHPNGIASTILTKCDPHWGAYIHYSQNRVLSVREAARLQSFPDSARFVGSLSEQYEQVGNAVPPLLAKSIGTRLEEVLTAVNAGRDVESKIRTEPEQLLLCG